LTLAGFKRSGSREGSKGGDSEELELHDDWSRRGLNDWRVVFE